MNIIDNLDITYEEITDNSFIARMTLNEFHGQPFGYLHGGCTLAFGETVAGYASKKLIKPSLIPVGQSITANHLKAKKLDGFLLAKGSLIHRGNTSHVWRIDMIDEKNRLISHMTVSNAIITKP